jgi:hypothetical protein
MQLICLFLIIITGWFVSAFSTVNTPLTLDVATGYRQDYINWKTLTNTPEEYLAYQEEYNNLSCLEVDVSFLRIYRDLYFEIMGGGCFLDYGKMTQTQGQLSFTDNKLITQFDASGREGSVLGLFGICVDFTPMRFSKVILTPLVGYGAIWKWLHRNNPNPKEEVVVDSNSIVTHSFGRDLEQKWYGVALGANVYFDPGSLVFFNFSYLFHFLNLKTDTTAILDKKEFVDSVMTNDTYYYQNMKVSTDGYAHYVKAKGTCRLGKRFLISFITKYHYLTSDKKDHIHKEIDTKTVFPSASTSILHTEDKFITRFWYLSYLLEIGCTF